MPYRLVNGYFHLHYQSPSRHVGSQPDGDSLWFRPDDPAFLEDLGGRGVDFNGGGFAQLRFEAIDALELHYKGSHQDWDLSVAARDFVLDKAGFKTVHYSGDLQISVGSADPHPVPGHILTRNVDPYGRPVAFVFAGTAAETDGESVYLETERLDKSLNADLARSGNTYPAFYTGLPTDLRNRVAELTGSASEGKQGLWAEDKSVGGFTGTGLDKIEKLAIWPKLFRRLVSYFKAGYPNLKKFDKWLRADPDRDDSLWIISKAEAANMHDVIKITGNKAEMLFEPSDLVVVPG